MFHDIDKEIKKKKSTINFPQCTNKRLSFVTHLSLSLGIYISKFKRYCANKFFYISFYTNIFGNYFS
jgi:hypothetical protein